MMLVLSLFPGIGLLDMAFEEEGFVVVRGPDLLWGGDIRRFHPPAGRFDGIIGGPPCQAFSGLANLARARGVEFENLIPEFERAISEAKPAWFVMENVRAAPLPLTPGYAVHAYLLQNRSFGEEQSRVRRITFGTRSGPIDRDGLVGYRASRLSFDGWSVMDAIDFSQTVTSAHGGERRVHGRKSTGGRIARYDVPTACRLQGLPEDFLDGTPLTSHGKLRAIANGVPLPMGRAVARAVKRALGMERAA